MMQITRKVEFSASHRLAHPNLSEAENRRLFGACYDQHGHNYLLEVTVRGELDAQAGWVMDFKDLNAILRAEILEYVDHKDLNRDVPFLRNINPTAENVAKKFWEILAPKVQTKGAKLYRIRLAESRDNFVEFFG